MQIDYVSQKQKKSYNDFLLKRKDSLIYYSLKFRDFLKSFIKIEDKFLVAEDKGKILGIFPCFIKINQKYGNVLNSSPFYGSNGGIVVDETLSKLKQKEVKRGLLSKFYKLEQEYQCISSTIITSPFQKDLDFYRENFQVQYTDYRLGQIMNLPIISENFEEKLLNNFPSRSLRRNIRWAKKQGLEINESEDLDDWKKFWKIHQENMLTLGGVPKPFSMFESLKTYFIYGKDYKIWLAKKDNQIISGLLILYFNKTAEYYTPAVKEDFRRFHSNTLLIFGSMVDAIKNGYKYYNFGGTSASQESLREFKRRWGSQDLRYEYFVKFNKDTDYFKKIGRENLSQAYEYFFVFPFGLLT